MTHNAWDFVRTGLLDSRSMAFQPSRPSPRLPIGRPIRRPFRRRQPIAALAAALLGSGLPGTLPLVLAQTAAVDGSSPAAPPAELPPPAAPTAEAPAPVAPPRPLTPPPPVPIATPAPPAEAAPEVRVRPVATPGLPSGSRLQPTAEDYRPLPPVRPGGLGPAPSPSRFENSLDALIRDGVVSPREVRVRGLIRPGNESLVREGCGSGAFSARECGTAGVVLRSRDGGEATFGSSAASSGISAYGQSGGEGSIDAAPLPPIAVPVTALLSGVGGRFRLTDVFNLSPRPGGLRGNGNSRMLYPLIGGSEVTSGFGWRMHPILGSWMMHSGRDLAAPEGTPVVASLSGRVVSSGDAGGYGLAVEIDHDNPRRRTLYGHLSEIYVREGDRVRQGDVIGRVGSTGRSTGPHLHFELRMPQEGGWVAVDPGSFDTGPDALGSAAQVAAGTGLPGGLLPGGGQPTDAVALLLGQLVQSLERPRYPLGSANGAPRAGATPAAPFPTDRLPERLPPSAAVPAPAPLPRRAPAAATPGG